MSYFGSVNLCPQYVNRSRYRKGKGNRYNYKISRSIQYSILDLTDDEEDSDSESESDSSISDSESSNDDGEVERIKAYVASIFEEKNKQRAVETIQPTGEEDVITLPDETLP